MNEQYRKDLKEIYQLSDNVITDLDRADAKPEVKRELLSKLKNINMFKPLKHINWFKPYNEPEIEKIGDEGFRVLTWDALIYLEKISCSREFQERKDVRDEILEIIHEITEYKIHHNYNFDNYRTSWFFIKILKNYPTNEITIDTINNFKYWFQTKFDLMLLTSEIIQGLIPKFLNDKSSEFDIQKAGIILMSLLKIREVDNETKASNIIGKKFYYLTGDYHWINDLIEDDNLLEQLANAIHLEFINFLIDQIKKQLIVTENKCSVELESNTVLICLTRDGSQVRVQLYKLPGKPLYNYFDDTKFETQEKIHLKEFNVDYSSKGNFINSFKNEFFNIELLANEKDRFSSVASEIYYSFYERETYESLYNSNERKPYSDPFDILSDFIKRLLVIKSNKDEQFSSVKGILTRLLHDPYLYFTKLALYVMGNSKMDFSEVFWENINSPQINEVIFEGMYFGGELKPFLNKLTGLNQHQLELLDSYIHRGSTFKYLDEKKAKYSLVWKQRLYQALSHIDEFKKKYEELRIITQQDSALAPAIGQISAGFVEDYEGVAPVTQEELISMNNSSIVDLILKLNELGTKESISSMNGLHNSLRDIFKQYPEKAINDLSPFLNSPAMFIEMVLSRIHKFPEEKKIYDAKKVIIFLRDYFYSVNWKEELQKEKKGRLDIHLNNLRNVFWILRNILSDDDVLFSKHELEEIFKIFSDILSLQELLSSGIPEFTTENENENFHMRAINSKLGSIIEAFIYYIRKETLDIDKDIEVKWSSKSKDLYEQLLKNNFYEAFNFVGARTNFFAWFDKPWLYEFIVRSDELYKDNLTLWKAYINGYFWDRRLFTGIYPRMKKNFMLLLETKVNDSDHSISGLIQQAVGAYLYNFDGLEKGLISYILKDMKPEFIKTLLQTLVEFKHSLIFDNYPEDSIHFTIKRQRIKVLVVWRVLYRYFNGKDDLTKEDKKIISSLSRLTEYLFEINSKNKDWLFQIAENINEDHYSASFIEDLNMLKDKGDNKLFVAEVIADLFIEMLKKNNIDYERENIFSVLFYLNGITQDIIKAKLNEILNKYRGKGNHELVDEFISRLVSN